MKNYSDFRPRYVMKNILLLESITDKAFNMLSQKFNVSISDTPFSGKKIAKKNPIHGIVTRGKGDVSQELIDLCPDLKAIARCGVGLDNINVAYAKNKNIVIINAPGSNADTVAEHTLALMLNLQRNLFNSIHAVKNNNWDFRKNYIGDEIRGKTLGIFGMGNIGQRVAKLAAAFGMEIIYTGPNKKDLPYTYFSLNGFFKKSDIISLHLPLNNDTRNLFDKNAFEKMRPHTLIINTSRGAIIDENELINYLKNKKIGGFAADVLTTEPPAEDSPLLKMSNVLITPHSASLTARTYNYMCVYTIGKLIEELN